MKDRETLDEAIDRVAARMTQAPGGDVAPVWTAPVPTTWLGRRVAGALGVLVLVAGLTVMNLSRVDKRSEAQPIAGVSSLVAWVPLPALAPVTPGATPGGTSGGHRFSGAEVAATRSDRGTPEGVPSNVDFSGADALDLVEADEELPETLASLDIAPVSVPALRVEDAGRIAPLLIPDLVVDEPSGGSSPRE